jgi:hypothetical protein
MDNKMKESMWKAASKYFLHGVLFLTLYFVLIFLWVYFLAALVWIGLFLGLIIGLILLFFIVGGLNSFLTNLIWSMPVKTGLKSLLGHGLVLFLLLLVVNIPHAIMNLLAPSLTTTILLLIIYAFVDGYVAKNVAGLWKKQPEEPEVIGKTPKSFLKKCINCGQEIPIASETCPHCGAEQKRQKL